MAGGANSIFLYSLRPCLHINEAFLIYFLLLVTHNLTYARQAKWLRYYGGTKTHMRFSIAGDALGRFYVSGTLFDSLVLAKYDSQGHLQWDHKPAPYYTLSGYSALPNARGNVYLTDVYDADAQVGSTTQNNHADDPTLFLAKFSPKATVPRTRQMIPGSIKMNIC